MAAATNRPKRPLFTSPRGVLKFPNIVNPDYGNEKFPKPGGEYRVKVIFDGNDVDVQAMIAKLRPLHDAAVAKGREEFAQLEVGTRKKLKDISIQPLYSEIYDKTTEEPTGKIEFNFKKKYSGERKNKVTGKKEPWIAKPPAIFDAKGNPITSKTIKIWGGTVAKINFDVGDYFIPGTGLTGLKLGLEGAQIIKLVSEGIATAEGMGFEVESDGFEYVEPDTNDTPPNDGEVAAKPTLDDDW
jgi:hypothetical protein